MNASQTVILLDELKTIERDIVRVKARLARREIAALDALFAS